MSESDSATNGLEILWAAVTATFGAWRAGEALTNWKSCLRPIDVCVHLTDGDPDIILEEVAIFNRSGKYYRKLQSDGS